MIKVLVADDHGVVRKGLRLLLEQYPELVVIGEAANGREALQMVANHQPDVILMDAQMPVMDGIEATRAIKANWPKVKVVMLTIYSAREQAAKAAGADAFLLKGCPAEKLIETILNKCKTGTALA